MEQLPYSTLVPGEVAQDVQVMVHCFQPILLQHSDHMSTYYGAVILVHAMYNVHTTTSP